MTENNKLKDLLMVLTAFVVAQLAGLLLISVLSGLVQGYWYYLLINAVCVLGVSFAIYLLICGKPKRFGKAENYSRLEPLAVFFGAVLLSCLAAFLFRLVFPQESGKVTLSENDMLMYAVYTIILSPVAEELAFRGAALSRLAGSFGANSAALISAAFFAAYHLDVSQMPYTFVLGYCLALLAQRSGSLVPCILVHAGNNLTTFLVSIFDELSFAFDIAVPLFGITGLVWLVVSGRWFRSSRKE
ncbi:MAG: CPBP family intramembrane metalloprotease [Oscillospiraceae bacterium]|nr:CPBP family intramembrane metalloprotease [Oscillospiraceae bacterium]